MGTTWFGCREQYPPAARERLEDEARREDVFDVEAEVERSRRADWDNRFAAWQREQRLSGPITYEDEVTPFEPAFTDDTVADRKRAARGLPARLRARPLRLEATVVSLDGASMLAYQRALALAGTPDGDEAARTFVHTARICGVSTDEILSVWRTLGGPRQRSVDEYLREAGLEPASGDAEKGRSGT